jgi:predicted glutamine amidotransferase
MCRMLALAGQYESVVHLLLRFGALSRTGKSPDGKGHKDGWGIGYVSKSITVFKEVTCAYGSNHYGKAVKRVAHADPPVILAHLRKASPNTKVTIEEVHPFQKDNYLFCHNGSIYHRNGTPLGDKLDSIIFFDTIMKTSIKKAIYHFRDLKYTSLNFLMTNGKKIWAYREYTEKEDYYTLYYLKTDDFVLFCSEPIIEGDWVLLGNKELARAHLDKTFRLEPL